MSSPTDSICSGGGGTTASGGDGSDDSDTDGGSSGDGIGHQRVMLGGRLESLMEISLDNSGMVDAALDRVHVLPL
ncbi:hypothetical protein Tco_1401889 [Tanacetum coccineum]